MTNSKGSEWKRWDLHLHTASSYDYQYKGEDSDILLCKSLRANNIAAVAITDHFKIDSARIEQLRSLESEITFFPGVELRTDKGSANLHLILIFSEETNLKELEEKFRVIMIGEKAKANERDETIYWDFNDIIEFAKNNEALITIHSGKKSNGVDQEISNATPYQQAIKTEIADAIDFFEVSSQTDISNYKKHVFSKIAEKPLIVCSDNHDPRNYTTKEKLWIKAQPTFQGLIQCLYAPSERVFVGEIPPALERTMQNMTATIASVTTSKMDKAKHVDTTWFDFSLDLNPGLVAIIGNKGSGKSALSDIIGHLCKSNSMSYASFLNPKRFRKAPSNYAEDYMGKVIWSDKHAESIQLSTDSYDSSIENAQYLPQRYIEEVCNDIDSKFQKEIDKVIFSYVDKTERGDSKNLTELIERKSEIIFTAIRNLQIKLTLLNEDIIKLENKKNISYRKEITDNLKKMEENIKRHFASKPKEVPAPSSNGNDTEYQLSLSALETQISEYERKIEETNNTITVINEKIDESNVLLSNITLIEENVTLLNSNLTDFLKNNNLADLNEIQIITPKEKLNRYISTLKSNKILSIELLNGNDSGQHGLLKLLSETITEKSCLIETANLPEREYQAYLKSLELWNSKLVELQGSEYKDETLLYYEAELNYLDSTLEEDYLQKQTERVSLFKQIYLEKENLANVYKEIYDPIKSEMTELLNKLEETITFNTEIKLSDKKLTENLLKHINQSHAGIFKGTDNGFIKMNNFVQETTFSNIDSLLSFTKNVCTVVSEDFNKVSNKIADRLKFYNDLFGLDYVGVAYKLKLGNSNLEELSPGERGIVLLVFYLAMSKNNLPIIIDQPEDNLDNQSVYDKLVPCICEAKKKRQVIIVTHNPNIAVACDAEQIIYCEIDKVNQKISYLSGGIEEIDIKRHVIDVLEGTMPAFDLRKRKYLE